MVCTSCIRSVIVQAGHIGISTRGGLPSSGFVRAVHSGLALDRPWNCKIRTSIKMMVDTGAMENQEPVVDMMVEKEDDGGIASGGWKRFFFTNSLL